jgi:hypothetical protein
MQEMSWVKKNPKTREKFGKQPRSKGEKMAINGWWRWVK